MQLFHLHPVVVHFPIALLVAGLATQIASVLRRDSMGLDAAASWLLWIGTATLWLAVGLGLVAERTAPHVPAAWEALYQHRRFGLWTAGIFTALSLWRRWRGRTLQRAFLGAWLIAAAMLLITAYHGGQLVYGFGMGVMLPEH